MARPNGFRIAARALRQLGAELITSDEIALNELIKNALDAGSKRVSIRIVNPFKYSRSILLSKLLPPSKVINRVHLERIISNCFNEHATPDCKLELSKLLEKNNPEIIESIVNKTYDNHCSISVIDNGIGMNIDQLQDSFLVIGTPTKWVEKQTDSKSELLGEKGVGRLSMMRLGRYTTVSSGILGERTENQVFFDWAKFDDPKLYLEDVDVSVLPGDRKDENQKGTSIFIKGIYAHWNQNKISIFIEEYLRRLQDPFNKKGRFPIDVYLNGKRQPIHNIYPWFKKAANFGASVSLSINENKKISLRRELTWRKKSSPEIRVWEEADLIRELECDKDLLLELGSLNLNLLWFNRSDLQGASIDHSSTEIKEELNIWCGGYAIYRDNFRIGMTGSLEDDWLKVDTGSLKSKGFSFNRYQTVGALSITQRDNPKLLDAANREKLINCDHLDLLKKLLTELVNKDLKSHIEFFKEVSAKKVADEATAEESLECARERLKKAKKNVTSLKKVIPRDKHNLVEEIGHVLKTQSENIRKYEEAVKLSKEQRIEVLELAGLGMVVDKVIHELARLTENTTDNLKKLEEQSGSRDSSGLIKLIREQLKVTNKRIRTVDSLSPSGRNRKEVFDLTKVTQTVIDGFSGRLNRHNVDVVLTVNEEKAKEAFNVKMVLGLVALVLENLLANSVYWLQQGLVKTEESRKIQINIDTESFTLSVRDNGPGIDPSNKEDIFKAYFTSRPKGKGLGLFICREIADYHQCSIYLDSVAELDGRLRTFIFELPKN